ncbi:MAG TPA: hypothetical protein VER96_39765 [Polyangiaceae bacterium]|nr:hypothetical protein [Polyangiaceae bacterium]
MKIQSLLLRWLSGGARLLALGMAVGCGPNSQGPSSELAMGSAGTGSPGAGGNNPLVTGGAGGGFFVGSSGEAGTGAKCERNVSLTAVTLGEPQPFDLIIVADNSDSVAWSRNELSNGLHDLLTQVQGRTVRVFLLTPTQYGASSATAITPLSGDSVVAWKDPQTGKAYQNAMTTFEQTCTDPSGTAIVCPSAIGTTPYHVEGTWKFTMPAPIAVIRPDMTDAEFAAQRDAVASAIMANEGNGSPQEQPLCTLGRYISQDPSVLPANAVFLLIEDEDDVSRPLDCLAGFSATLETVKAESAYTACTSNCDVYRYSALGSSKTKGFNFTCAAFDDLGNRIAGTDQTGSASQGNYPDCTGIVAGTCTADEAQITGTFCEKGRTLTSCQRECTSIDSISCSVDLHDATVNPCTQAFTLNGTNYQNLAAYCAKQGSGWKGCSGGGLNIQYTTSLAGGFSPKPLMFGSSTAEIGTYFKTKANAVFKANAYQLEAIVFEPEFSCSLKQGQSNATNIAQFVGDKSHLFPICESYAPALAGVLSFAQGLIQTEFSVQLAADEHVSQVIVVAKNGSERTLDSAAYTYSAATQTLSLSRSALSSLDSTLRVEVTSECRPVIK